MFIYSVRAGTLKFFGVVALSLLVLISLAVFVPPYEAAEAAAATTVRYTDVKTNADRVGFIGQFGYTVENDPTEEVEFTLPKEFDRVLSGYNEIQKEQGLDLSRYTGKKVTRYTYTVTNYPAYEGTVYINLILYRDRVVACDICSADPAGFVSGLFLENARE